MPTPPTTWRRAPTTRTTRSAAFQPALWRLGPRPPASAGRPDGSAQVEPVEAHDLVPDADEVADELLPRIVRGVDLGQRPELGVRAEDQVGRGGGPPDLARLAVAPFVHVLGTVGRRPLRAHVEQV